MVENQKYEKHIALVFSLIFPGAGFIYQKKWFPGFAHGLVHLMLAGKFLYNAVVMIHYMLENGTTNSFRITMLVFWLIAIITNWFFSIRATQNYE